MKKVSEKVGAVFLLWVGISILALATGAQIAAMYSINDPTFAEALLSVGFIYSLISIPPIAWYLTKYKTNKIQPEWFLLILLVATVVLFCINLFPQWFNYECTFWLSRIILPDIASLSISIYFCAYL